MLEFVIHTMLQALKSLAQPLGGQLQPVLLQAGQFVPHTLSLYCDDQLALLRSSMPIALHAVLSCFWPLLMEGRTLSGFNRTEPQKLLYMLNVFSGPVAFGYVLYSKA